MEELVASTLARELRVPHLVARFLVSRGVKNVADAYKFLYGSDSDIADPMLMKGMGEAVEWLLDVQKSGEEIFIFGDYDLDGMTSVTLLSKALAEIGIATQWRLPNRFGDGYGLSVSAVDEMHEAGARNLITVDTGITSSLVLMQVLRAAGDPAPRLDAVAVTLSVIATWWLAQSYLQQWLLWLVADIFTTTICLTTGQCWMAVLYTAYIASAVYGYFHWKRKGKYVSLQVE